MRYRPSIAVEPYESPGTRRNGGLKSVRDGVWRVDVELPRARGERRRRVSRTVYGSQAEAEEALEALTRQINDLAQTREPAQRAGRPSRRRSKRSGAITQLGVDRWLIGVEGPPDPVTGQRRRFTRTVRGSREQAEVELASLKLAVDGGDVPTATRAKTVRMACDLYLTEARTESQTKRTDQSACRRICATVLPGGRPLGAVQARLEADRAGLRQMGRHIGAGH